ncbi:hypothetical protein RhiJN_16894 [Ceratobasidium sp. AG-Ba]|nr:hypothetical protein RhiJN_16894 [Ceratobasidium sp. AG-Ba]QRW03048.1 hypothetical protein RhiLY_02047 [Ceratobasidium sp. AG-Ba]
MSIIVAPDQSTQTSSKRYQRFEDCLYVAAQSCSSKWTWEQFVMCFPTWVSEETNTAGEIRVQVSNFMKNNLVKESGDLLRRYDARGAIDSLDSAVAEAKKRLADGIPNQKDEWKPELDPRSAVRARVIPVLDQESARLQKELEELEKQNRVYMTSIGQKRAKCKTIDQESKTLLGRFELVCQTLQNLDDEELQQWMLAADEAGTTTSD